MKVLCYARAVKYGYTEKDDVRQGHIFVTLLGERTRNIEHFSKAKVAIRI